MKRLKQLIEIMPLKLPFSTKVGKTRMKTNTVIIYDVYICTLLFIALRQLRQWSLVRGWQTPSSGSMRWLPLKRFLNEVRD